MAQLKADLFQAKIRIAQLEATVQDRENRLKEMALSSEQQNLITQFRKDLHAGDEDVWDWESRTFKPKPPANMQMTNKGETK